MRQLILVALIAGAGLISLLSAACGGTQESGSNSVLPTASNQASASTDQARTPSTALVTSTAQRYFEAVMAANWEERKALVVGDSASYMDGAEKYCQPSLPGCVAMTTTNVTWSEPWCRPPTPAESANGFGEWCVVTSRYAFRAANDQSAAFSDGRYCVELQKEGDAYRVFPFQSGSFSVGDSPECDSSAASMPSSP